MIGVLYVEIFICDAQSLKDKRSVLKSLITKLKQRLNVSVAETDHQNVWQRAQLTIVAVASEKIAAEKELQRALALIDGIQELERTITNYEWL